MAHHEMIDSIMKELMRGIKIAAEPINQHNCVYNDTGAISNTGQCREQSGEGGGVREWKGEGWQKRGPHSNISQCQEHINNVL